MIALAPLAAALAVLAWPSVDARWRRPSTRAIRRLRWPAAASLPRRAWVALILAAIGAAPFLLPLHVAAAGVLLGAAAVSVMRARIRRKAARRAAEAETEVLMALSAELRAGHDLAAAFGSAATAGDGELARVLQRAGHAIELGESAADALDRSLQTETGRDLAGLVRLTGSYGIPLADAVDTLADRSEQMLRQRRELAGLLAGPRATAAMLAALPLFGIVMGESIGAEPVRILVHSGAGGIALVVGAALAGLGIVWTERLVRRAEQ